MIQRLLRYEISIRESRLECFNEAPDEKTAWDRCCGSASSHFDKYKHCWSCFRSQQCLWRNYFCLWGAVLSSLQSWVLKQGISPQSREIPEVHLEIFNSSNTSKTVKGKQSLIHSSYQSEKKIIFCYCSMGVSFIGFDRAVLKYF